MSNEQDRKVFYMTMTTTIVATNYIANNKDVRGDNDGSDELTVSYNERYNFITPNTFRKKRKIIY